MRRGIVWRKYEALVEISFHPRTQIWFYRTYLTSKRVLQRFERDSSILCAASYDAAVLMDHVLLHVFNVYCASCSRGPKMSIGRKEPLQTNKLEKVETLFGEYRYECSCMRENR